MLTILLMDAKDQLGNEVIVDWWLPGSVEGKEKVQTWLHQARQKYGRKGQEG